MNKVELIYFSDCPNTTLARERLLQAFETVGATPQWQEWERNDPACPGYARAYGSPTILVNGVDVTGMEPGDDVGSCRVYAQPSGVFDGAPGVEVIVSALRQHQNSFSQKTAWRSSFASLPAIGAAALPKLACPACWPAYSGLLSSVGISFVNYTPYLLPLTIVFLLISLMAMGWRANRRHGYGPMLLGLAASIELLTGKFIFDSDAAMYVGIVILVAASLWNAWPNSRKLSGNCPACV